MQFGINYMTNSVDPDQPASSEAGWSGSPLFAKFRKIYKLTFWHAIYAIIGIVLKFIQFQNLEINKHKIICSKKASWATVLASEKKNHLLF